MLFHSNLEWCSAFGTWTWLHPGTHQCSNLDAGPSH
uniref:Uncharacterized protein n=1 Tax=Anguilla anguilla TaxID=7936 RepID=A0A0E9QYS8_ANGAN